MVQSAACAGYARVIGTAANAKGGYQVLIRVKAGHCGHRRIAGSVIGKRCKDGACKRRRHSARDPSLPKPACVSWKACKSCLQRDEMIRYAEAQAFLKGLRAKRSKITDPTTRSIQLFFRRLIASLILLSKGWSLIL